MFRFRRFSSQNDVGLVCSQLYDQQTFFPAFIADAKRATSLIIIESPFITYRRLRWLYPILQKARQKGVRVIINTRDPQFHDGTMRQQAADGIAALQSIGVEILYTGNHHRKLAIIDQHILYEGSLNILSQSDSCEVMRRIESVDLVKQMVQFTGLDRWYTK